VTEEKKMSITKVSSSGTVTNTIYKSEGTGAAIDFIKRLYYSSSTGVLYSCSENTTPGDAIFSKFTLDTSTYLVTS
jgi:hypothetical protein